MIVNRIRDSEPRRLRQSRIKFLHPCIQSAHDALQFGELLHQFGGQVGLRQARRFVDHARTHGHPALLDNLTQPTAQTLHSPRLLVVAAEVFLEGNVPQQFQPLQQRPFLIRLPEKSRIAEPGAKNALVAVSDQPLRIAVGIQHRQEMGQQRMVRIFHRKIFLMVTHNRDQHFFRQRQKLWIEPAQNHRRKFRQVHHRVEERLVLPPPCPGNRAGSGVERFANLLLAFCTSQNLGRTQSIHIRRPSPRNRHAARGQNAVPARNFPRPDPVKLQRNRLPVEHRHHPPHRTHKPLARLAPVHILRPVDRGNFNRKILRENLARTPAFLGDFRGQVFALRSCDLLQLRDVDSSLLRKRMRRRRGLTIFIGDVHRRPSHLLGDIRLSRGEATSHHR